jgi:hypothetical protein
MRARWAVVSVLLCACAGSHQETSTAPTASAAPQPPPPASTAAPAPEQPAADTGDEAGARAMLQKLLAPGADRTALSKALRPAKDDYAAMFDAATAKKLQPLYDARWDKEPLVIEPRAGQTELKLASATTEELRAGGGKAGEFPGGWKRIAPHLAPHRTWYRFSFVEPGHELGRSFDGLTFVNGHWAIVPKPWRGL